MCQKHGGAGAHLRGLSRRLWPIQTAQAEGPKATPQLDHAVADGLDMRSHGAFVLAQRDIEDPRAGGAPGGRRAPSSSSTPRAAPRATDGDTRDGELAPVGHARRAGVREPLGQLAVVVSRISPRVGARTHNGYRRGARDQRTTLGRPECRAVEPRARLVERVHPRVEGWTVRPSRPPPLTRQRRVRIGHGIAGHANAESASGLAARREATPAWARNLPGAATHSSRGSGLLEGRLWLGAALLRSRQVGSGPRVAPLLRSDDHSAVELRRP